MGCGLSVRHGAEIIEKILFFTISHPILKKKVGHFPYKILSIFAQLLHLFSNFARITKMQLK